MKAFKNTFIILFPNHVLQHIQLGRLIFHILIGLWWQADRPWDSGAAVPGDPEPVLPGPGLRGPGQVQRRGGSTQENHFMPHPNKLSVFWTGKNFLLITAPFVKQHEKQFFLKSYYWAIQPSFPLHSAFIAIVQKELTGIARILSNYLGKYLTFLECWGGGGVGPQGADEGIKWKISDVCPVSNIFSNLCRNYHEMPPDFRNCLFAHVIIVIKAADVGCLSRIPFFRSRIQGWQDPGSALKNWSIFNPKSWY